MTWPWIVAALAGMAFMYAAGRFDWLRAGRHRMWREARAHFEAETRPLVRKLADAERELAWHREAEHAQDRNPRGWDNGAGYRSTRSPDFSQPSKEASHAHAH